MAYSKKTGKVKILPLKHKLRGISSYNGEMGILTTKDEIAFHLVSCKEEFYHTTSKCLGWRDSKVREKAAEVLPGHGMSRGKDIYTKSARIVMHCRNGRKAASKRVLDVVEKLRKRLKLRHITTVSYAVGPKNTAILIDADKFFLRSPVSQSALLTFIRGAMFSTFEYSSLDDFICQMIKFEETGGYDDESRDVYKEPVVVEPALDDAYHFFSARKNGTLDDFLDRKLDAVRRRGFMDCRFYRHENQNGYRQDGIAEYIQDNFKYQEMTKQNVIDEYKDAFGDEDEEIDDGDDDEDNDYEETYSPGNSSYAQYY